MPARLSSLALLLALATAARAHAQPETTWRLTLLTSASLDGALAPAACRAGTPDGPSIAHLAAAVRRAQEQAAHDGRHVVATLHLGDFTGPAALGRFLLGRPGGAARYAELVARLGFTHAVAGNNLLDLGAATLGEYLPALDAAGVKVLNANVTCQNRPDCAALSALPSRTTVDAGALSVAIAGATHEVVLDALDPEQRKGLVLAPLRDVLPREAALARSVGVDLVIGATHLTGDAGGLGPVSQGLRDLDGVDLLVVNHLGDVPRAAATLLPRSGPAVAVSGAAPLGVVRFDFDVERVSGRARLVRLEASRVEGLVPDPSMQERVEALRSEFCAELGRPLGVRIGSAVSAAEFTILLLDALRERSGAEVALVNDAIVERDAFPLAGELSIADLHAALPYDDLAVRARVPGARLRGMWRSQPMRPNGLRRVLWAGIEEREGTIYVNGRPLEDSQPYTLVLPDFVARGGDRLVSPLAFEPVRGPDGEPSEIRDAVIAALSDPATAREALAGTRALDLWRRFRLSWNAGLTLGANDTRFANKAATKDPRFQRNEASALRGEATGRIDADERDHALRASGRARYARTSVSDAPFSETEDQLFTELLYRLRVARRLLDEAWYAPVPYASTQLDTEFVPNTGALFRRLEAGATAGVRFQPKRPFELKAGAGLRRELLDPAGRTRYGFELGYELPRFSPTSLGGLPVDLESNLDYFVSDLAGDAIHEGRLRARLLLPLGGPLAFSAGVDLLALSRAGTPFALLSDLTLSITARFDGAHQRF